jgi:hypothetical protein
LHIFNSIFDHFEKHEIISGSIVTEKKFAKLWGDDTNIKWGLASFTEDVSPKLAFYADVWDSRKIDNSKSCILPLGIIDVLKWGSTNWSISDVREKSVESGQWKTHQFREYRYKTDIDCQHPQKITGTIPKQARISWVSKILLGPDMHSHSMP